MVDDNKTAAQTIFGGRATVNGPREIPVVVTELASQRTNGYAP